MNIVRTTTRTLVARGPRGVAALLHYFAAKAMAMLWGPGRECPLCGWHGHEFHPLYLAEYDMVRRGAVCPGCGAWERHRAYARFYGPFLQRVFATPPEIVHFAPEKAIERVLAPASGGYRKSNYENPAPDELQLDLCNLSLANGSVDAFVMNHVACCVPSEELAASEMFRALRPGGIVLVGENLRHDAETLDFEKPRYGGALRQYGTRDFAQRFAPFEASLEEATGDLTRQEMERYGLPQREYVIVLRKPAASTGSSSG